MQIIKNIAVEGIHGKPIVTDVFFNKNTTKKPVTIFCHGYKGFKDWGAWNLMAENIAKANVFFIKFNFSHNGGTLEKPIDFPDLEAFGNNNYTKELDDLKSVIDWLFNNEDFKNEADLSQITLFGHSRAGGIVTIKAEEDTRITKVISLAGVADYGKRSATTGDLEQWQKDGVKYIINGRTKQKMPHYIQFYEDFIQNEERLTIKRAVSNLKIPYLIIHGNEDTSVLIDEAFSLKEWCNHSELKIIDKANHVFNASHPWEKTELPKELKAVVTLVLDFVQN
ncbi:prolyl oligopeptidase family serine peptidase [Tamlana sp. 62-3]|uniref:Prolyl oligopeptidase family serine peptidase n=1 Tax=Neotamlana sargassicola TaxID=2883125 RepID=A0A9X1L6W8_9FLAO|nr:prolyl oligopeptidase family serine peptidase [Tamlana sargassicola]MCB4807138.1 prolyl oligopeptidase family serine peptidase [Tamlana sargassicola]